MKVIPVLDLKNGLVVHAQRGQRDAYQPIRSCLGCEPDIFSVINALLALAEFKTFYIADLNAITGHSAHEHDALLQRVVQAYPALQFWVDKGYQQAEQVATLAYYPVLGSESYNDEHLAVLSGFHKRFVLSLDYQGDEALGAKALFADTRYWPEHVILMTLAQVGSGLGPDFVRLSAYRQRYPQQSFVAAGGVRTEDDLLRLKAMGIDTALVASALHSGALGRAELSRLTG
ncbi:HisA/HisF-related TIM barrel protein [Methylocucumis oryzae]|uniref:Nickel transporter n=1 Tax=Methylocucumis oryzae TaxID=1632867 RepID=A0A0F3IL12_9GAMM|nr:HisA/HisF-related TIM barrel protein [Methylocucumis oryzae]KJV07406.1 hypothetical protein VZ94_04820 [Methylocucumis oryzae]